MTPQAIVRLNKQEVAMEVNRSPHSSLSKLSQSFDDISTSNSNNGSEIQTIIIGTGNLK